MRWASSSRKTAATLAAFFFWLNLIGQAFAVPEGGQKLPLDPQPLAITTAGGELTFMVEVADDDRERSVGLMFRPQFPIGQGMLFDFRFARQVTMWMKNTLVPLDIIFINDAGTVTHIKENAGPLSLSLISSGGEVRFALELAAGSVKLGGIALGDVVRHRVIDAAARGK